MVAYIEAKVSEWRVKLKSSFRRRLHFFTESLEALLQLVPDK